MSHLSKLAHSSVKRPIHKKTTFSNSNVTQKVNIVRSKIVNTTRPESVVNAILGNRGNPQQDLQDKGVIDNGCSRHMTETCPILQIMKKLMEDKLPLEAKAANTACYVQNRVLVVKPHNKTPYTLFQGKFDGKADEGFFVGYSLNSKAFRVFNNRTRIVEENLHISDDGKKVDEDPRQESECKDQENEDNVNNTNNVNAAGINRVNVVVENTNNKLSFDPEMPTLEDISTFNFSSDYEDDDEIADMNNLDTTIQVSPTPTKRIHKDHLVDQVIRDLHLTTQTRNMSKNLEEHGFVTTIHQRKNHKDLQNCLFSCLLSQEEPKR
nr:hypothetical protein [Tanacetum cinerariifolium]